MSKGKKTVLKKTAKTFKKSARITGKSKTEKLSFDRATIISLILDESGSMDSRKEETIRGFNEYVDTLNKNGAKIIFTLTKFNGLRTDVVHSGVALEKVAKLNNDSYRPQHGTPLYDAVGRTIRAVDEEVGAFPRDQKPAVLFVIMTDGQENESREFKREDIVNLIKTREALKWDFVYLGADHDAFKAAKSIGINLGLGNATEYSKVNLVGVFTATANSNSRYAEGITRGLAPKRDALFTAGETQVLVSTKALGEQEVANLVGSATGGSLDGASTK